MASQAVIQRKFSDFGSQPRRSGPAAHDIDGAKEGWRRQLTQGLDMRGMRQLLQAIVVTALAAVELEPLARRAKA